MYAEERQQAIARSVSRAGRMSVAELADTYRVTTETIRRDLSSLERAGLVRRVHGGVVPADALTVLETGISDRDRANAAEKDRIATQALELVPEGGTVVLDAGTTTGRLAAHLAHRELTVVTNGLTAILALAGSTTVELIILGGRLRHPNEAIVGASVIEQLRHISADRVFLGTDGLSPERGLCSPSLDQAHLKHAMLHSAEHAYVLADRSKLGEEPFHYWTPLDRPHTVLTNRT